MIDNKLDLNLLKLFVEITEAKSLAEAARRTGMTRSNVSMRLKKLENSLETQLFRRNTRSIELTQQGELLYEKSLKILEDIAGVTSDISHLSKSMKGYIRVRIPTGFGHLYLSDIFIDFIREYPDIDLKILINDRLDDLIESEVDFAIKITSHPNNEYVAKKICDVQWCLSATPSYLQDKPVLLPADLAHHKIVTPAAMGKTFFLKFVHNRSLIRQKVSSSLQSGSYTFLLDAATKGLGITLLPRYAIQKKLKTGALVEVLPNHIPEGVGNAMYFLTIPNKYTSTATKQLMNYLQTRILALESVWHKKPR
ncbi:MAG: LysR family transcriptional regulator [Advenella sp.]|nr:LysR family transcriptional regulator [Advenella sp.]